MENLRKPINSLLYPSLLSCSKFAATNTIGIVEFTGVIQEPVFKQALKIIQKRHPFLATRIEDEQDRYLTSENVPEIPLEIIPRLKNNQWQSIVKDQLHRSLPLYTGPLVRVVYLAGPTEGEIVWVFNHLIVDGISRTRVAIEFFEIIQALNEQRDVSESPDNAWEINCQSIMSQAGHGITSSSNTNIQDKKILLAPDRETNFIPYDFSERETASIQEKYRASKSSLQGALSAAMAKTLAENIRQKTGQQAPVIICHHPVNLRSYLSPSLTASDVGPFFSVINNEIPVNPDDDVWDLACYIKKALDTSLEHKEHLKIVCPKKLNPDLPDQDVFMGIQAQKPLVAVSQLGTITIPDAYGDMRIKSMRGLYNWSVLFNHEDIFIVTGLILKRRLVLTFVYIYPYVSHEQAQIMTQKVVTALLK